ncbi:MAG TPA: iron ABC transporter permease [Bacillota bacterium]|nr:iron ABC transporter permease [Bacillota bacterium]HPT87219.1 iron ABC transporter permease [Bacillota bacterium]
MNVLQIKYQRYLFLLLFIGVILVFAANLAWGSVPLQLEQLWNGLTGAESDPVTRTILLQIRMPRTLAAMIGGAALAAAGLVLQVFFRNPVVDAFVLGISSGSGLMVGLVMLAGVTFGFHGNLPMVTFLAAFTGALLVMVFVLFFSCRVQNVVTLLVAGLVFGYLCNAINSLLIAFAQKEQLQNYIHWSLGSFAGVTWPQVLVLAVVGVPALMGTFILGKSLNALHLGEDYARSMGVEIVRLRQLIIIMTSCLTAAVTAFAGPVAFVGLAVPHLGRLVFRTDDNRVLIPAVILMGAIVTAGCDLAARSVMAPVELPLTALTSVIGAPVVIYLVLKGK